MKNEKKGKMGGGEKTTRENNEFFAVGSNKVKFKY